MGRQILSAKSVQRCLHGITVTAVIFSSLGPASLWVPLAQASILTNTTASLIPSFGQQKIKASSAATAVVGYDIRQDAGETLSAMRIAMNPSGGFNINDLATMTTGTSSGLAFYRDDKSAGTIGSYDSGDTVVTLSAAPDVLASSQVSKLASTSSTPTGAGDTLAVTPGDLVFANTTANPTATAYGWHIASQTNGPAAGTGAVDVRLDDGSAAPTYVASSRYSYITPAATAYGNGVATSTAGQMAVVAGDLIFGKRRTETVYNWHMVTTSGDLSDEATENTAALDDQGSDPAVASSTQFSKLVPSASSTDNGAGGGGTLAVSVGDMAFVKLGTTYDWYIVTGAGDLSSSAGECTAKLDNVATCSLVAASSKMSKISTANGTVQITTATTTDASLAINAGDIAFGLVTANPTGTRFAWHSVTTGGTGFAATALRLDNSAAAPTYGIEVTFVPSCASIDCVISGGGADGNDYFLVTKTSVTASSSHAFSFVVMPGDVITTPNLASATTPIALTTPTLTIDSAAPTISATGPSNGASGVANEMIPSVSFNEEMDPSTLNSSNVTFTAGGNAVNSSLRPNPFGFDVVVSSPPTFVASSRFARVANTTNGAYFINGSSPINVAGTYNAPTLGDIVMFQQQTFPPEFGIVTNATMTGGTFAINGFPVPGPQRNITKFAASTATGAVSGATTVVAGDLLMVNTGTRFDWHIVTTGAAMNGAGLRIDDGGSQPSFMNGSNFSSLTPSASATDNGVTASGTLALSVGDLVFAKIAGGSYSWHIATTAGELSSDATEGTAILDNLATSTSRVAASSKMSKLTPGAQGAATDAVTVFAGGDIVFADAATGAATTGYGFHLITGPATGLTSSALRLDNKLSALTGSTAYTLTVGRGVKDKAGNALAATSTTTFTTGSVSSGNNTTPPGIVSTVPSRGFGSAPLSAPISLTFSVDMATTGAGSATSTSNVGLFTEVNGQPGTQVTTSYGYTSNTKTLTVTPGSALTANTGYILKVANTTTSATGIALPMTDFLFFKTASAADATAPTVMGVFPGAGATGVAQSPVITVGFSEDMGVATISGTTITLKKTSNSAAVTGTVSYSAGSKSANFVPNTPLEGNVGYTITVISGSSGAKDISSNALAADYTSTFTTTNTADSVAPMISYASADNFGVAVTFNEPMKTGGGSNAVDNIANYTIDSPAGASASAISLSGKTVTYDMGSKTARITGLALKTDDTFKVTVANTAQDLASNSIDTTGTPAKNTSFGKVQNSMTTGGQLGPGTGTINQGEQGMNPTRVSPMVRSAGATSNYMVEFLAGTTIPLGGRIVLTFPSGFTLSGAAAVSTTNSFCNTDINRGMTGTVTIASVTGSGDTITIVTGGAATGANAMICMDLSGIVNSTLPSSSGYSVDIKTQKSSADSFELIESKTASPFNLGSTGANVLTVNVFKDNVVANGTLDAGEEISAATVFLFSPAAGGQEKATNASGTTAFTGLQSGDYMIGLKPNASLGNVFFNSAPQPITVSASSTKNFALGASTLSISGTVTGTNGTKVDVFASSDKGFFKKTLTLTGGADAYTLPVQSNTTYNVGVGPAMPETFSTPGSPPPPPPDFTFMPPANITVAVAAANVPNKNFVLSSADKTIAGTVLDSSGAGVSNAGVFCRPVQASTTSKGEGFGTGSVTSQSGTFSVKVNAGTYLCGVFKPGMPTVADKQIFVPTSGANSPTGLNFTLDVGTSLTISGTIKDDSGNAVAYAGVGARKVKSTSDTTALGGDSGNFIGGPSDVNGAYTLYVTAGTWVVDAFAPGVGRLGTKTVTVSTTSLSGQDFSAQTLSLGAITGTVTQAGTAVQGANIRAEGSSGSNMAITDSTGTYTLKVPAGSYTVTAFIPGSGELTPLTSVAVTANTTTSGKNFAPLAPITLTIRMTDGANPLQNGYVDVRSSTGFGNGTGQSTTTGIYAVYSVSVPPGTYTVRGGHPAFGSVGSTSSVSTTQTITYTATAGQIVAVTGTVTGDGVALGSAYVSLVGTPTGQSNIINVGSQTASNGTFSVSVPAGSYKIRADKKGYKSPADAGLTVAGATAAGTIALTAASKTITGTVTLDGSPVSGASVDANNGNGGYATGQTDSDGAYSLAVDTGTWNLTARSIGYEGTLHQVAVAGSSVSSQTITLSAMAGFTAKAAQQENVTPTSGGQLTNSDIGSNFKLNIPANALGSSSNANTVKTQVNTAMPQPPTGSVLNKSAVTITAVDSSGQPVKNLNDNVTLVMPYSESDLPAGASEANLVVGVWNDATSQYDTLPTTVDTVNNTLTAVASHFSDFAPLVPTDPTAPSTPTGFAAANTGTGTTATLSWTASSGAATYNVYTSTDNVTFPLTTNTASTSYTATGLTAGTPYYFKVSAVNSGGNESSATSAVTLTPTATASSGSSGISTVLPQPAPTQTQTQIQAPVKVPVVEVPVLTPVLITPAPVLSPAPTTVKPLVVPAVAKTLVAITQPLSAKSKPAEIKTVQEILKADLGRNISTSGKVDAGMKKAIQDFQVKYKIAKKGDPGFGDLGPKTRAKLNTMVVDAKASVAPAPKPVVVTAPIVVQQPIKPIQPAQIDVKKLVVLDGVLSAQETKSLQMVLNARTSVEVKSSGKIDTSTTNAIKEFQIQQGIAKPGQVGFGQLGPKTRAAINKIVNDAKK